VALFYLLKNMQFPPSELVLNNKNEVYHLGLSPENISDKIILVGDQDRVAIISSLFDEIEHQSQHREFVCHTGIYKGKRISVLSTGIGTDNIDIVMNELDALFNIDLIQREEKQEKTALSIVRIGTCGILQASVPVHSFILSKHSYGLDNIAHFYAINFSEEEREIGQALSDFLQLPFPLAPYFVSATNELTHRLESEKTVSGITVTSSGFYGPQGRELRLKNKVSGMNDRLSQFDYNGLKVTNFEMESSAIFAIGKALGHECATICLGIANRPNNEFSTGYETEMQALITYVLERI
jgi:uridine phosphorylase